MTMKKCAHSMLALLLVLTMCIGLVPTAFAAQQNSYRVEPCGGCAGNVHRERRAKKLWAGAINTITVKQWTATLRAKMHIQERYLRRLCVTA